MASDRGRTHRTILSVLVALIGVVAIIALVFSVITFTNTTSIQTLPPALEPATPSAVFHVPVPTPLVHSPVTVAKSDDNSNGNGPCDGGAWPMLVKTFDYLVVGGGPGGAVTAYDLTTALLPGTVSVGVIEARDRVGGNFWDVNLVKPAGYNNVTNAPLRIGMGGLRVNMLTLLNERRLFNELNIPLYYTPFRQWMFSRGRNMLCAAPAPSDTFTNFCSNDPKFIDETQTNTIPYGSAYQGLGNTPLGDPSFDAWCYLTYDANLVQAPGALCNPKYGADPNSIAFDDITPRHPLLNQQCNTLLDGNVNTGPLANPALKCPQEACKDYVDFKSFIEGYLSPEYAIFLEDDNVGFKGDYLGSNDACGYLNWNIREWNTASNNGMPVGGMSQLPIRAMRKAEANGAKLFLKQPAMCIRRRVTPGSHLYEVRTPSYTIKVNKFLFLNLNPPDLHRVATLGGDIVDALRAKKETTVPRNVSVATVSMQWAPNAPAWFYTYVDPQTGSSAMDIINGNWSLRQYGDLGCFSRLEIWDTPWHRFHNGIRVVYSDGYCQSMWDDEIRLAEARLASGMAQLEAYKFVTYRVMEELKASFPGAIIPNPVWVRGAHWEHAWSFLEPLRNMTNRQIFDFAFAPLGNSESLCLIGDAYNGRFSGHAESTLQTSRHCLTQRTFGSLNSKLSAIYATRDAIIPNDFSALTACPSGLSNEYCGPYGPYNNNGTLHTPFCVGNTGGVAGSFACVPYCPQGGNLCDAYGPI